MATKPKAKAIYKGVVLVRVYNKETKEVLGYVAKPSQPCNTDGTVKTWYQITCDNHGHWHCNCPATRECLHIAAAKELCEIRVKQGRPGCHTAAEEIPVVVAPPVAPETSEAMASLVALARAIPGIKPATSVVATKPVAAPAPMAVASLPETPKYDYATAPLQPRGFFIAPTWEQLATQKKRRLA